jgi:hypothetical protein
MKNGSVEIFIGGRIMGIIQHAFQGVGFLEGF